MRFRTPYVRFDSSIPLPPIEPMEQRDSRTVGSAERSIVVLGLDEALSAAWWLGLGDVTRFEQLPSDWLIVG